MPCRPRKTTFITPFGRFKYMRAPYGVSSISEHYDRRMYEAFQGISGFRHIVDDIVIYDSDATQHAAHVLEFLNRCAEKKITLNLDKCKFCETSVSFAGFQISAAGYQVDHTIIDAISKFPTPANRTDLQSFFGLVNQLSASTNFISTLLTPLRPLLSTKNDFQWSVTHDQAFKHPLPLYLCCHFSTLINPLDYVQMQAAKALDSYFNTETSLVVGH